MTKALGGLFLILIATAFPARAVISSHSVSFTVENTTDWATISSADIAVSDVFHISFTLDTGAVQSWTDEAGAGQAYFSGALGNLQIEAGQDNAGSWMPAYLGVSMNFAVGGNYYGSGFSEVFVGFSFMGGNSVTYGPGSQNVSGTTQLGSFSMRFLTDLPWTSPQANGTVLTAYLPGDYEFGTSEIAFFNFSTYPAYAFGTAEAVPEPSSWALLIGSCGVALLLRRIKTHTMKDAAPARLRV